MSTLVCKGDLLVTLDPRGTRPAMRPGSGDHAWFKEQQR